MPADLMDELGAEIERIWQSATPSVAGLRQLSRGILLEALDADSAFESSFPVPQAVSDRKMILANAVVAARSIAWTSVSFATLGSSSAEDLVIAALLCDAGRLRPGRGTVTADDPSHPAIAAALAGSLDGASVSLPQRIIRHHERSDGTGFPAALTDHRLTAEDRLLAAAIRFAELFEADVVEAAMRLHNEARRGLFDAELTANFVWAVGGRLPAQGGFGQKILHRWPLTDRGRRRLRFDEPHCEITGPHFLPEVTGGAQKSRSDRLFAQQDARSND